MSDANTFRCTGCGIVYSTRELADSCVKGDAMIQCNCGECEDCYRRRISTLETRIADVEGENTALWNKLDAEIERRVDAESRVAELERERVAAVDKYDQAMAALDAMSESHGNVAAARDEAVGLLERVDDRREAEARVAELAREMGAMAAALKEAVATNEELRAERDIAARGRDIAKGDRDRANEAAIRDRADRDRALAHTAELERDLRIERAYALESTARNVSMGGGLIAARADLDEAVGLLANAPVKHGDRSSWVLKVRAFIKRARLAAPAPDKEPRQPGPGSGT